MRTTEEKPPRASGGSVGQSCQHIGKQIFGRAYYFLIYFCQLPLLRYQLFRCASAKRRQGESRGLFVLTEPGPEFLLFYPLFLVRMASHMIRMKPCYCECSYDLRSSAI
jgi:hypothetical protein